MTERAAEFKPDWAAMLDTALTAPGNLHGIYDRFYSYSYGNQMLLLMQGVIEPVATYKRWQDLGRQVLKGSKAKAIIRPIIIEKKDAAGDVESRAVRFKAVRAIFALSDTEGEELLPVETPAWDRAKALDELDIKQAPFLHLNGNVQGYSVGREYAINPVAAYPTKTMFHECAHIVCGHTAEEAVPDVTMHRGLREFEAEGSSYLVMNELELMTDDQAEVSRAYVQSWMHNERPPDTSIRRVFTATDKILRAGRVDAVGVEE